MKGADKLAIEQYLKKIELARAAAHVNPFETKEDQRIRIMRAKLSVKWCVEYYFPHYATSESADFQLEFADAVKANPTIKAFAQWGRGLAKSVWCDVILPFWLWLNDQAHYMVLVAANETAAAQLLGDLQGEFEGNPQIINDFGEQKLEGFWEWGNWMTRGCAEWKLKPFIARALGMGMPVRGLRIGNQRPDLWVLDDLETRELIKNPKRQDEVVKWVERDVIPTMDGPIRRLLYANNRFAVRMIQTELQKKHPGWWVHHIPACDKVTLLPRWYQKYPADYYRELASDDEIGMIALLQEYIMEPVIEGKIFKPEQIIWDKMPALRKFKVIVGHWDIAYAGTPTSDYNAVKIWGLSENNLFWYIQGFVKQTKMKAAVQYMCAVQKALPEGVIISWQFESQFWNDEVQRTIDETCKEEGVDMPISKVETNGNKYQRMLTMQPRYQNNRIRYNRDMEADNDTQVGLGQLYGIEPGYTGKDDSPDADHQCIEFLKRHIPASAGKDSGLKSGRMKPKNERI